MGEGGLGGGEGSARRKPARESHHKDQGGIGGIGYLTYSVPIPILALLKNHPLPSVWKNSVRGRINPSLVVVKPPFCLRGWRKRWREEWLAVFFGLAFSFSRAVENVCCLSFFCLVNHGMGIDWVGVSVLTST